MKLSDRTNDILKNFVTINPSLVFKPGNVLKTISPYSTIIAEANIEDEIPQEFGVYELSQFLDVLRLFKDPTFSFGDKVVDIKEGQQKIRYRFSEPSLIKQVPDKPINFPVGEIEFRLEKEVWQKIEKAALTMSCPEIAVVGDRESISVVALNIKNDSSNQFSVKVGETTSEFKMVFLLDNMKILPDDYDVEITSKGLGRFKSNDMTYYIAVEQASSKFEQ